MKGCTRITGVVAIVLLCGCVTVSGYYVPVDFDSEISNWICLENRPYYTIELSEQIEMNISTLQSGRMTYVYIVVGLERGSSIDFAEMLAHVQFSGANLEAVELFRQTWQNDDYEAKYGENYQYFTIGTRLIAGEERFTLHLPYILALGEEFAVNPILFEKKSRVGLDVCPSGMAW